MPVLEGRLRQVDTRHPNGTPIRAIQLVLDRPVMFQGIEEPCVTVRIVHLAPPNDRERDRLRRRIGTRARVMVEDMMQSHTAWHIGEAVGLRARLQR